jgi:hypothetical protein
MHIHRLLLFGILAVQTPAIAQGEVIPNQFLGVWAASSRSCPMPEDDILKISAGRVDFYERTGKVVALHALDSLHIELELEMSGEGDTWRERLKLTLSKDLRTLTDIESSEKPNYHYSRVRCG